MKKGLIIICLMMSSLTVYTSETKGSTKTAHPNITPEQHKKATDECLAMNKNMVGKELKACIKEKLEALRADSH